jgi:tetratricopeptide (TPR) repeat protein
LPLARELCRRAIDAATQAGNRETAAKWAMGNALREAEYGNLSRARAEVRQALGLARTRDVTILAALALARTGRVAEAQAMADELQRSYPSNTLLAVYWLPTIRAASALGRNHAAQAVDLLRAAAPYDLASPPPYETLYPVYLRGEAYLRMGRAAQAAAEFQKLRDHEGIVSNNPLGAAARVGLARAWALLGDVGRARAAYRDFLALWKAGDSSTPILVQAKAESAKLR